MSAAPDFLEILRGLLRHEVDFILVGGVAAILEGAPVSTFDLAGPDPWRPERRRSRCPAARSDRRLGPVEPPREPVDLTLDLCNARLPPPDSFLLLIEEVCQREQATLVSR